MPLSAQGCHVALPLRKAMIRSLIRATTDAARRALAWNLDDMMPPKDQTLFTFASQLDVSKWLVYSDSEHGGLSTASLDFNRDRDSTALFTGNLSVELKDPELKKILHSGFSGIRTRQGVGMFDLDPFDTLAFRLKGDGRCYISTLRTQSWAGGFNDGNSWQAFIFAPKDEWYEVKIPFSRFLPTWRGRIIDSNAQMNLTRICGMTLAVSAVGGPKEAVIGPGAFRLELDWIKALRSDKERL